MTALALALLLAASDAPAQAPAAKPKWSMAVTDLNDHGAGKDLTALVSEAVLAEAHKLDGPKVIGASEIRALLGLEREKQLLGCAESSCLAELAGALGADKLLSGSIGKVGDSWTIQLQVVDARKARLEAQAQERIVGGKGEEFLDALGPMFEKLFPGVPLKPGETRGSNPTLRGKAHALGGGGLSRNWAYGTGAVSLVALGAGVGFGLSSRSAVNTFNDLNKTAATTPVKVEDVVAAHDRAKSHALYANVLFGVGGATALAAVVLFALADPGSPAEPTKEVQPEPKPAAGLAPLPGGGVALTVAGRF